MRLLAAILTLCAAVSAAPAQDGGTLVIRGARIITVSGEEIPSGTIVIREGRIAAVGAEVEVPWDAEIIEAEGRVVMPGWVEPATSRGMDRANENTPSVPFVTVLDSINPVAPDYEDMLRQGVTTVHVVPGPMTMIGGRGAVVRPHGLSIEAMTHVRDSSMAMSLHPPRGQSRMAHLAALRRELNDVRDFIAAQEGGPEVLVSQQNRNEELELKRAPMHDLFSRHFPAFVWCSEASDVSRARELATEYGFDFRLILSADGWRAVDDLRDLGQPVVLDPNLVYWERDERTHEDIRRVGPAALHEAGIPFALTTDPGSAGGALMWYQVATCVRHGVPRADAIRAATMVPAQILGLADQIGSIEVGRLANLQVLTGDPLDPQTWVDLVILEGRVVYRRSEDSRLRRLLGEPE